MVATASRTSSSSSTTSTGCAPPFEDSISSGAYQRPTRAIPYHHAEKRGARPPYGPDGIPFNLALLATGCRGAPFWGSFRAHACRNERPLARDRRRGIALLVR